MKATPPFGHRPRLDRRAGVAFVVMVLATPALTQEPWTVTVTPTMNPLPVGFCAAVQVSVRDASGSEAPRNPQGYRVTLADFDLTVTSPNPGMVVGQQIDANHWSVCACQGAAPGSDATITASYPARSLVEGARVKGISLRATAGIVLSAAKGNTNSPACKAPQISATSQMPAGASLPAPVAIGAMPVPPPITITPASAPTRSDPVARVDPQGKVGERVAPYQPGPVTVDVGMTAKGWWYEPAPITVSIDVDAHGSWYVPTPATVDIEMSATGTWIELSKNPIAPREPARQ